MSDPITAVVVNHEAGEALTECVASLRRAGVAELVVVDNASSDGSLERLAAADRDCILVPTGANLGYGTAANRGAARSSGEYILIANPDIVVERDAVKLLVAELDAHPEVAVVGPKILDPSGATYPSARAFPNFRDAAGHALIGLFLPNKPLHPSLPPRRHDPASGARWTGSREPFSSCGGSPLRVSTALTRPTSCTSEDLDLWLAPRSCRMVGPLRPRRRRGPRSGPLRRSPSLPHAPRPPPFDLALRAPAGKWGGAPRLPVVGAALGLRLLVAFARSEACGDQAETKLRSPCHGKLQSFSRRAPRQWGRTRLSVRVGPLGW